MAYKAVFVKDGKYYSISSTRNSRLRYIMEYKPYKWTYPKIKGSKAFVFKKLVDACHALRDTFLI